MVDVRYDPWKDICDEYRQFFGKVFVDTRGNRYRFFGMVDAEDDYYYGMSSIPGNTVHLLSCVGHLGENGHGFQLEGQPFVKPSERKCWQAASPMSARVGLY